MYYPLESAFEDWLYGVPADLKLKPDFTSEELEAVINTFSHKGYDAAYVKIDQINKHKKKEQT